MKFIKNSLNAGELSPQMDGRTDYEKYYSGLTQVSNGIPLLWGGVSARSGTEFIAQLKGQCKLVRFEFSTDDTVVIVFGENHIRFVKDGAYVVVDFADVSAWGTGTVYAQNNIVSNGDNYYYCIYPGTHTSGATFAGDAAKWVQMAVNADGVIYEIYSPYSIED
jgi:hypothetical protein